MKSWNFGIELAIYDDRGGVQAPKSYKIQMESDGKWIAISDTRRTPSRPVGGQINSVTFEPVRARKLRIVFENRDAARSGISEIFLWND